MPARPVFGDEPNGIAGKRSLFNSSNWFETGRDRRGGCSSSPESSLLSFDARAAVVKDVAEGVRRKRPGLDAGIIKEFVMDAFAMEFLNRKGLSGMEVGEPTKAVFEEKRSWSK
jgi:hypothetical protein